VCQGDKGRTRLVASFSLSSIYGSSDMRLFLGQPYAGIRKPTVTPDFHWISTRMLLITQAVGHVGRVLQVLARGAPEARPTQEAKASLLRLAKTTIVDPENWATS
jgi:hypothetical protein